MSSETDGRTSERRVLSGVREAVGVNQVVMLLLGVLAGASVSVLEKDAVAGSVSGLLLGTAGLAVAAVVYRRFGSDCGCTGSCGDSCSYDP